MQKFNALTKIGLMQEFNALNDRDLMEIHWFNLFLP